MAVVNPGFRLPLAVALTICLWASSFSAMRAALEHYDPARLNLLRFLVASLVLAVYVMAARLRLPDKKDWAAISLLGTTAFAYNNTVLTFGMVTVTAGSGTFLVGMVPVCSALLGRIFLKEHLGRSAWLGITIGFGGVLIISLGEGAQPGLNSGAFLIVSGAFAQGIYYVFQRPFLRVYAPLPFTAIAIWSSTLLLSWALPGLWDEVVTAPWRATAAVVFLGVGPTFLAHVFWSYALSHLPAWKVAANMFLMPGLGIFIGWVWLRELPPLASLAGGLVTLTGVALVNLPVLIRRR